MNEKCYSSPSVWVKVWEIVQILNVYLKNFLQIKFEVSFLILMFQKDHKGNIGIYC